MGPVVAKAKMTKDKAFRKFERKRPLEATISAKLPAIKAGIKAPAP